MKSLIIFFVGSSMSGVKTLGDNLKSLLGEQICQVILGDRIDRKVCVDNNDVYCPFPISHDPDQILIELIRYVGFGAIDLIILPNNFEVAYEVAYKLRTQPGLRKIRVIGIVHANVLASLVLVKDNEQTLDAVFVSSQQMYMNFQALTPICSRPLFVVPYPNFRKDVGKRTKINLEKLSVIYFGRLVDEQKQFSRILRLIHGLATSGLRLNFDVYGDGHLMRDLLNLRISLSNQNRVILNIHGEQDNRVLKNKLNEYDIMVLTSDYEGVPISLIEALNEGVVPVVMDYGLEVREIVRDEFNGFIVPLGDIEAMISRVKLLDCNREVLASMSDNAMSSSRHLPSVEFYISTLLAVEQHRGCLSPGLKTSFSRTCSRISRLASRLTSLESIAIWGGGHIGRSLIDVLILRGFPLENITVVDRDLADGETHYVNIIYCSPESLLQVPFDGLVIASKFFIKDIMSQIDCLFPSRDRWFTIFSLEEVQGECLD